MGSNPGASESPSPPLWTLAYAGNTKSGGRVDVRGGIAVGVLSRDVSAWIPAFAGMTRLAGRHRLHRHHRLHVAGGEGVHVGED